MTNSPRTGIVLLVLAQGLAGCSGSVPSVPSAPSSFPQPTPIQPLVVFTDRASGFSTSDVRDVDEQIVQFTTAGELIWTDGTRFPGYRAVADNLVAAARICASCSYEVRFGTMHGERRAYFTVDYGHDNPGTIVDIAVVGGELVTTQTDVGPPGTYTLSGLVFEVTPGGQAPVEGVHLYRPNHYSYQEATTDKNGFYSMRWLDGGMSSVGGGKEGYQAVTREVSINGDTRFDIQLVRR